MKPKNVVGLIVTMSVIAVPIMLAPDALARIKWVCSLCIVEWCLAAILMWLPNVRRWILSAILALAFAALPYSQAHAQALPAQAPYDLLSPNLDLLSARTAGGDGPGEKFTVLEICAVGAVVLIGGSCIYLIYHLPPIHGYTNVPVLVTNVHHHWYPPFNTYTNVTTNTVTQVAPAIANLYQMSPTATVTLQADGSITSAPTGTGTGGGTNTFTCDQTFEAPYPLQSSRDLIGWRQWTVVGIRDSVSGRAVLQFFDGFGQAQQVELVDPSQPLPPPAPLLLNDYGAGPHFVRFSPVPVAP